MKILKFFFLYLFVGLLAISALQFLMLDQVDLDRISMVEEEQQESLELSAEVFDEYFKTLKFEVYSNAKAENFKANYSVIHQENQYPEIHLPVLLSPPELS